MNQSPSCDPAFLPASLVASSVGTWDYDVARDRLRYCRAMAALYGLPPEAGVEGVPMARVVEKTHPHDRALSDAERDHLFHHGGAFAFEHRIVPAPHAIRWVLVRGFFELNASGRGVQGLGVVVDLTEGRQAETACGPLLATNADDGTIGALDRATKHMLASRRALDELDPASVRPLRAAADALLLEIGLHIARTFVPVRPSETHH